ncbi:MAG: flagellar biosynthesis/type III secretory pathway protein FliH [Phenylobacterium sp.]|jgi:flagellar biosynthesis/type III secretory pathway protein FliH
MLFVGNIVDIKQFVQGIAKLPESIRGEAMTAAEQLRALGREEGREEGLEEGTVKVAINSLKEGIEPRFVARITGLELAVILKLKARLESQE